MYKKFQADMPITAKTSFENVQTLRQSGDIAYDDRGRFIGTKLGEAALFVLNLQLQMLGDDILADMPDSDLVFCEDGSVLVSVNGKTDQEIEACVNKCGMSMRAVCRKDIAMRKPRDSSEPQHEVIERIPPGQLKKTVV